MKFLIPPTSWTCQAKTDWVLVMLLALPKPLASMCPDTAPLLALLQEDYWALEMSIDGFQLYVLALWGTFVCPLFLLGHHLPLGLQSDRGTGEAHTLYMGCRKSVGSSLLSHHSQMQRRNVPGHSCMENGIIIIVIANIYWALTVCPRLCSELYTHHLICCSQ